MKLLRNILGHNSKTKYIQKREKCSHFQRRLPSCSEKVTTDLHTLFLQQQDRDPTSIAHMEARGRRYIPYAIPSYRQRIYSNKQNQTQINMVEGQNPPERRIQKTEQDVNFESWFKVTIPFGIKYDEEWLLNLIQSQCSVPFTPVEFRYEKMQAQFFVNNASTAFELKKISDKLLDNNNERISIFISASDVPHSLQKEVKSEKMEQPQIIRELILQPRMNKGYDVSQQDLNIYSNSFDRDMATYNTKMISLNPGKYVTTTLTTHEENISKMETSVEIEKGKGQTPEEMHAESDSFCTTFPDNSTSMNSILELFPKLLRLDGQASSRPPVFNTETHKKLPTCKGSYFGSEMLKDLILQFLQQYYTIYDYGDRQDLLDVYHEEACFSLTITHNFKEQAPSNLCDYLKYSRNMKNLNDPYVQRQLLKHRKCDIVNSLKVLPKTQHDLNSFVVDTWFQTEKMLCFSVSGLFKEVEGNSQGCVHVFTRTFITTHSSSSSLCIVNDKLFLSARPQEMENACSIPMPLPSGSEMAISQEQQMMQAFSTKSGMKWSEKDCQTNYLDYSRVVQALPHPKSKQQSQEPEHRK
ncbi:nuclear RNA export factor 3 isoform X2 [Dipodomys merriami]|uniref:nuclear RNA export factor 3 isoform X2 n=1 Tax=Dipodomys merriami TaxID=94247 RepID=UPI003855A235